MSRADEIFQQNCRDILENGVWDTDQNVRPHWEDGTPAHTVKKFGIINRYDLRQEFPILTIRRTYFKTCIDELLWIWQKKSNNIHDLRGHIWDSWADENGSIGKAYGYQLGVKHQYPEGAFDQVDRVLYDLRHNPASRRIMTNLYNFQDLHEMALYPCVSPAPGCSPALPSSAALAAVVFPDAAFVSSIFSQPVSADAAIMPAKASANKRFPLLLMISSPLSFN